jgi:peptide/nickel transport system permease protein
MKITSAISSPAILRSARFAAAKQAARPFIRNKRGVVGFTLLLLLVLIAIVGPLLAPYDPNAINIDDQLVGPSPNHLLGTDGVGRDVFTRLIYGARISLYVGIVAAGIAATSGGFIGLIVGYVGGLSDSIVMRIMDAIMAFPSLVLAIAISTFLGRGLTSPLIAIGIVAIPTFARLSRGQVLSTRENDYVMAAKALGAPSSRIILRHILPNVVAPIIVQLSLVAGFAIITEASLSFLGLGAGPPTATWGSMIRSGYELLEIAPWLVAFPGIAIFLAVMSFNLSGDGLRDGLDPYLRSRG